MAFLPLDARGAFQIVATLGPASHGRVPALAAAGATAFRLNASHLTPDEAQAITRRVRSALPDAPLVIDLQGAKLRLGVFGARVLTAGDRVRFTVDPAGPGDAAVPLPHRELFASVQPGDTLSCDDDRLRLRVDAVADATIDATSLSAGPLRPRKGINVVEHPVHLTELPAHDRAFVEALQGTDRLAWAFSFMRDGSEAAWLRACAAGPIVGKVEHPDATHNLEAIDAAVDAVWICRGDLGAQLGAERLARFVASLEPRGRGRPWLMAGQVLEHLTEHAEPTRSEVCHLHDLAHRGFSGIVLSDETAIGKDPVRALTHATALARAFARA